MTYKVFGEPVVTLLVSGAPGVDAEVKIIPLDLKIGSEEWWHIAASPYAVIPIPSLRVLFIRAFPYFAESCSDTNRNLTFHTIRSIMRLSQYGRLSNDDDPFPQNQVNEFCRAHVTLYEENTHRLRRTMADFGGVSNFYQYSRNRYWRQHAVSLARHNYVIGAALARAGEKFGMPPVVQDFLLLYQAF